MTSADSYHRDVHLFHDDLESPKEVLQVNPILAAVFAPGHPVGTQCEKGRLEPVHVFDRYLAERKDYALPLSTQTTEHVAHTVPPAATFDP